MTVCMRSYDARRPSGGRLCRWLGHHVHGPLEQLRLHEIGGRRIQVLAGAIVALHVAVQIGTVQRQRNQDQELPGRNENGEFK